MILWLYYTACLAVLAVAHVQPLEVFEEVFERDEELPTLIYETGSVFLCNLLVELSVFFSSFGKGS